MNSLSYTALLAVISTPFLSSPVIAQQPQPGPHLDQTREISAVEQTQRMIVHFSPDQPVSEFSPAHLLSQHLHTPVSVLNTLPRMNAAVALLTSQQARQLSQLTTVLAIEPDQPRTIQFQREGYALPMIQALDIPLAVDHPQKVCVIDTGVASDHPDIPTANLNGEVSNTLSENINLGNWFDDDYGHGTFITGLLTAIDDREGIQGVVGDGSLAVHQVKVIHNPNYWQLWSSDVIAGIDACLQAGSTVINLSIAGRHSTQAEQAAVTQAFEAGALLVGAGGNRGSNDYFYPASYDEVIAVNAVDSLQQGWRYNQHHDQTELVAPGVGVRSTMPDNRYANWDGTSVAAPFVSGAAALVWSHFPDCSNANIRDALQQSALDLGDAGRDDQYGFGLVQTQAAIDYLTQRGCSSGSGDSMAGQVITTRRNYPNVDTDFHSSPIDSVVVDGNSDAFVIQGHASIDLDPNQILIDFRNSNSFGSTNGFNGYTFRGFQTPIKQVTVEQSGIHVKNTEWGDDYIYIHLEGGFTASSWVKLHLTF